MTVIVFMVAGMSSRFGGQPKQMAQVGPKNETLIEYSVNQALKNNFSKLVFITNPKTEKLFRDIFGDKYQGVKVSYIEQKYNQIKRLRPWGTADAICHLCSKIDEPFIMVNGDDIYGESTFKTGFEMMMKNNKINIISGLKVIDTLPETGNVNRGIIYTKNNKVIGLKEMLNINRKDNKELFNELANMNFIGLQLNVLEMINEIVVKFKEKHKNDPKIECILTNILNDLVLDKKLEMEYFEMKEKVIGITNPGDEIKLKEQLKSL